MARPDAEDAPPPILLPLGGAAHVPERSRGGGGPEGVS
ncbi:Uncharacterized protein ToN1_28780 [Aromatoleum petrolei]|nr:Uncharacterized protein ToN1_28780 [Aromatoleum petrolei]